MVGVVGLARAELAGAGGAVAGGGVGGRGRPALLVSGDLLEVLPQVAAQAPAGATLVVFHSAVLAYLSAAERARFELLMGELRGHWVSNEGWRAFPEWEHARPSVEGDFTLAVDGRVVAYTVSTASR